MVSEGLATYLPLLTRFSPTSSLVSSLPRFPSSTHPLIHSPITHPTLSRQDVIKTRLMLGADAEGVKYKGTLGAATPPRPRPSSPPRPPPSPPAPPRPLPPIATTTATPTQHDLSPRSPPSGTVDVVQRVIKDEGAKKMFSGIQVSERGWPGLGLGLGQH